MVTVSLSDNAPVSVTVSSNTKSVSAVTVGEVNDGESVSALASATAGDPLST